MLLSQCPAFVFSLALTAGRRGLLLPLLISLPLQWFSLNFFYFKLNRPFPYFPPVHNSATAQICSYSIQTMLFHSYLLREQPKPWQLVCFYTVMYLSCSVTNLAVPNIFPQRKNCDILEPLQMANKIQFLNISGAKTRLAFVKKETVKTWFLFLFSINVI